MRVWVARQLRRVATWLDPGPDQDLLSRARVLTQAADASFPSGYGEAKRHQVYSRLMKEFPEHSKRALSRAIEGALDA